MPQARIYRPLIKINKEFLQNHLDIIYSFIHL